MRGMDQRLWGEIARLGAVAVAGRISDSESLDLNQRFGTRNYRPLPVNLVHGRGAQVWDGAGTRYLDCIGAYSAMGHGHLNPSVVQAMKDQLEKVTLTSRAFFSRELGLFLQTLTDYCGLDMACPMNTGAEAVETCLKLARKWAYTVKGVPDGEAEIVVFHDNFHGRTTTIVGFSSEPQYKRHFGPFTPGFVSVPFGDLSALESALSPRTAAVLAEPIQAEGGVIIPPQGWMEGVRKLCDLNQTLLVWDEVQTGFCRTGKRFAWQHERAEPDLLAVGKPLGGGLLPVSAAVGKRHVMEVFEPGDHGSTFGGNPLACVVAVQAMCEMEVQDYARRSAELGERLLLGIRSIAHGGIKEVRGRGLLVGMEVHADVETSRLSQALLAEGVLTKETRSRTFRFTPPITIEPSEVDEVLERTGRALRSV